MALMVNWPISLSAMHIWDSSKIIGHPVQTTDIYEELLSHLTEPDDPALHEQELSRLARVYTSDILDTSRIFTASTGTIPDNPNGHITPIDETHTDAFTKSSLPSNQSPETIDSGAFTRDGSVGDDWSGVESLGQRRIYQDIAKETQSNVFLSGLQAAPPWRDMHILDPFSSEPHMHNLGEGLWEHLADQLENKEYYHEVAHTLNKLPASQVQKSRRVSDHPPSGFALEDRHPWSFLRPSFPPSLSFEAFDEALHNGGSHSNSAHDSVTGIADHWEAHDGYIHDTPAFSNAPYIHEHDQHRNFKHSLDFRTFNNEPESIAHGDSWPPSSPAIPSVSSGRLPLETLGESLNHVTHGTSQRAQRISPILDSKQGSEWSTNSRFQDSARTFNPLLQYSSPGRMPEASLNHGQDPLSRSRHLKRPSQTHEVETQSSKEETRHNPPSLNEDDGSIGRINRYLKPIDDKIHSSDSSTRLKASGKRAIEKYYGTLWYREKYQKTQLADLAEQHFRKKPAVEGPQLGSSNHPQPSEEETITNPRLTAIGSEYVKKRSRELISNSGHEPLVSRALVDTLRPKVLEYLQLIDKHQDFERHAGYIIENMYQLWDNYLEMVSICSEVVSSNGVDENLVEDLHDAYNWLAEKLSRIPKTQFEWLPIQGQRRPPGNEFHGDSFVEEFDRLSIHDGTILWLKSRTHDRTREHVSAVYLWQFMDDERKDWIAHLTPSTNVNPSGLTIKTLMTSVNRVRRLKFPSPRFKEREAKRLSKEKERESFNNASRRPRS